MKKILFILALLMPLILSAQPDIINFDELGSTWESIDLDTLYFSKDSTYITGAGDTIKFVVDDTEGIQIVEGGANYQVILDPAGNFGSKELPTLAFGDGNSGLYELIDNILVVAIAGGENTHFTVAGISEGSNYHFQILRGARSATVPTYTWKGDENTGIGSVDADSLSLIAGGVEGIRIAEGGGVIDVTITDTLSVPGFFDYTPPHGGFSFADSSVTLTMAQNDWVSVTNPTNTLFTTNDVTLMTFDGDSLTIDATHGGDYMMAVSLSFSGTASDAYEVAFFKNNAITAVKMERTTSQTDVGNVGFTTYLEGLVVGDDITFKIRNTASNDDATVISCSWVTWLLHL